MVQAILSIQIIGHSAKYRKLEVIEGDWGGWKGAYYLIAWISLHLVCDITCTLKILVCVFLSGILIVAVILSTDLKFGTYI